MPQFPGEAVINEKLKLLKTSHLHIVLGNVQGELYRRERKEDVRLAGTAYKEGTERSRMLADAFLFVKHDIVPTKSPRAIADFLDAHDGKLLPCEVMFPVKFDIPAFVARYGTLPENDRTPLAHGVERSPVKKAPYYVG